MTALPKCSRRERFVSLPSSFVPLVAWSLRSNFRAVRRCRAVGSNGRRHILGKFLDYWVEQGVATGQMRIEEIFSDGIPLRSTQYSIGRLDATRFCSMNTGANFISVSNPTSVVICLLVTASRPPSVPWAIRAATS